MEVVGTQNSRDDRTSVCRSFDSTYHPCSQSRKISIGVMADSMVKSKPKSANENEASVPIIEKPSKKISSIKDMKEKERSEASFKVNQIEKEQNTSPRVSTKSTHPRKLTSEEKFPEFGGKMERDEEEERDGTKKLTSATANEVFMPEKEAAEDKATGVEDKRQTLKKKIWEIFGANSAPNKQPSQDPEMGGNDSTPEPEIYQNNEAAVKSKKKSDTIESDSQGSDHSPKRAVTRSYIRKKGVSKAPATKTRDVSKLTSAKKNSEKNIFSFNERQFEKPYYDLTSGSPKSNGKSLGSKGLKSKATDMSKKSKGPEKTPRIRNSMRSYRKSPQNHSVFGTENGNKENGSSLLSNKNKGSKAQASRFSFEKLLEDNVQPESDINKIVEGAPRASLSANKVRNSQSSPSRKSSRFVGIDNGNQENESSLSSATKRVEKGFIADVDTRKTTKGAEKNLLIGKRTRFYQNPHPEKSNRLADAGNEERERDSSVLFKKNLANISQQRNPHHWVQQEDFGASPFRNDTDPRLDLQNPIFEFKAPAKAFSPGICSSPVASKLDKYTPDVGTRTFNEEEEAEDSPLTKSPPTMAEQDSEDEMNISSPEKMDSENSREDWATEASSSDIGITENPQSGLYPNKRSRSQEKFEFRRFSPILVSPEDVEDNDGSQASPEINEENGLASAISLLALALRRVEGKIRTITSKKSTEVLMSVAEEVHLQIHNAEFQFERDVGKLTSLNKSQRKHLETELEEQQEQLKIIYQKFKADVSQHIQGNKSKVEMLQGQEKELRLFLAKQKASHNDVLKQLEKSIQSKIGDAETKISDVHKMGREKMHQLKQDLGKCFKEGRPDH